MRLRVRGQDLKDALSQYTWRAMTRCEHRRDASLTPCGRSSRPQPRFLADGQELRRCFIDVAQPAGLHTSVVEGPDKLASGQLTMLAAHPSRATSSSPQLRKAQPRTSNRWLKAKRNTEEPQEMPSLMRCPRFTSPVTRAGPNTAGLTCVWPDRNHFRGVWMCTWKSSGAGRFA